MVIIRNPRNGPTEGKEMAAYLNREPTGAEAQFIRLQVLFRSLDALHKRDTLREAIALLAEKGKPIPGEDPKLALWHPIKIRAEFRLKGRQLDFQIVSETETDWALYTFGKMLRSGDDRLRCCPKCAKFFYAAGRSDNRFCSTKCRVLFWRKTPLGRKRHAEDVRRSRRAHREMEKGRLKGARLKTSRKILRKLG